MISSVEVKSSVTVVTKVHEEALPSFTTWQEKAKVLGILQVHGCGLHHRYSNKNGIGNTGMIRVTVCVLILSTSRPYQFNFVLLGPD